MTHVPCLSACVWRRKRPSTTGSCASTNHAGCWITSKAACDRLRTFRTNQAQEGTNVKEMVMNNAQLHCRRYEYKTTAALTNKQGLQRRAKNVQTDNTQARSKIKAQTAAVKITNRKNNINKNKVNRGRTAE